MDKSKTNAQVTKEILKLYREYCAMADWVTIPKTDAALLKFDPNDLDELDPSPFYEQISKRFFVKADDSKEAFGGFGGTLKELVDFIAQRWNGKLHEVERFAEDESSASSHQPLSEKEKQTVREVCAAAKKGDLERANKLIEPLIFNCYCKKYLVDDMLGALLALARWHWHADRIAYFGKCANMMLAIGSTYRPADDPRVAKAMYLCGLHYAKLGMGGHALRFIRDALAIQEKKLGPEHEDTVLSRTAIERFTTYLKGKA